LSAKRVVLLRLGLDGIHERRDGLSVWTRRRGVYARRNWIVLCGVEYDGQTNPIALENVAHDARYEN